MNKVIIPFFLLLSIFFMPPCGKEIRPRPTNYFYTPPKQFDDNIRADALSNVGIDTNKIVTLTKLILADSFPNIHSLLIVKDNKLVYENYFAGQDQIVGINQGYIEHGINDLHDCRSISKSVVSACIGIAIQKGLIKSVDDSVFNYFPDYKKYNVGNKSKLTIRHLLTMSSGLDWNESVPYTTLKNTEMRMDFSFNPIKLILSRDLVHEPGTEWNYNGGGTQILAEIIKRVSGITVDKFAEKYLFLPLGIKKYAWLTFMFKKSLPLAASGLRLRSRDFAKFGLMYMNDGVLNDSIILNKVWVQQSLSPLIARASTKYKNAGYGFQFWTYADTIGNKIFDISEAKGNGGQAIFFCKKLNLMVVTTAGNYNNWSIVNNPHEALVKYIIPAVSSITNSN